MNQILIDEFLTYGIAAIIVFWMMRKRFWPGITVVGVSSLIILIGELINIHVFKVAIWNSDFWLWLPGNDIPIYSIVAGAMTSLIFYSLSVLIVRHCLWRLMVAIPVLMCLGLISPYIEQYGLSRGYWMWQKPYVFDLMYCYWGVYIYYMIFIVSGSYVGWVTREYLIFKKIEK